jgi:hypothetical protein
VTNFEKRYRTSARNLAQPADRVRKGHSEHEADIHGHWREAVVASQISDKPPLAEHRSVRGVNETGVAGVRWSVLTGSEAFAEPRPKTYQFGTELVK